MRAFRNYDRIGKIIAALLMLLWTTSIAALPVPMRSRSLDGLWQSDGYGLMVELHGTKMSVHQITSISCIAFWTADRTSNTLEPDGSQMFRRGGDPVKLSPGSSPETLWLRESNTISAIRLSRISERPKPCATSLADTPQNNFDVFSTTFAEQFALFDVYQTDWEAVDHKFRSRVTSATTPEELFEILRAMVEPFRNAHINITADAIHRQYIGYKPDSQLGLELQAAPTISLPQIFELFNHHVVEAEKIIADRYVDGKLRSYCNDVIKFGMLAGEIGYLRMTAFEGYASDGGYEENSRSLEAALDGIFKLKMKGLIIDVRMNLGGADPFALAIASRLTGEKYLAFSKVARNNLSGPLHLTEPQPSFVEVSPRPGFRGKVILLIGPDTISGGEGFTMALMGREPHVTTVGENTQGVFSDVFGHRLPNGWYFGVPNELYVTKDGKSFDRVGISPDVRIPVFPASDLEKGRDGALEKAIEILRQ